jgi:sensor domain CHASE-containing protein
MTVLYAVIAWAILLAVILIVAYGIHITERLLEEESAKLKAQEKERLQSELTAIHEQVQLDTALVVRFMEQGRQMEKRKWELRLQAAKGIHAWEAREVAFLRSVGIDIEPKEE